jgi:hypothetical protein
MQTHIIMQVNATPANGVGLKSKLIPNLYSIASINFALTQNFYKIYSLKFPTDSTLTPETMRQGRRYARNDDDEGDVSRVGLVEYNGVDDETHKEISGDRRWFGASRR